VFVVSDTTFSGSRCTTSCSGDIFLKDAAKLATILSQKHDKTAHHRTLVYILRKFESAVTAFDTTGSFRSSYGSLSATEKAEKMDLLLLFIWDSLVMRLYSLNLQLLDNEIPADTAHLTENYQLLLIATEIGSEMNNFVKFSVTLSSFAKSHICFHISQFLSALSSINFFLTDNPVLEGLSLFIVNPLISSSAVVEKNSSSTEINKLYLALQWIVAKFAVSHLRSRKLITPANEAEGFRKLGNKEAFVKYLPTFSSENFAPSGSLEDNQFKANKILKQWMPLVSDSPEEKRNVMAVYRELLVAIKK
jgi:hypothetical protein